MVNLQNGLIALVSMIVVLGIMIFVHEWGHFIAAKLSGVRVDVFSFGFGTRLFGFKWGETDYRLSALPFGGYVRMAGDNPVEERTGGSFEFLSKPRWVRVMIAVAGPAMNVLLALFIYWGIFWWMGIPVPTYFRQAADVAAVPEFTPVVSGVQAGDRIISVNGAKTPTWSDVYTKLKAVNAGSTIQLGVTRHGTDQTLTATAPAKLDAEADRLVGYPLVPPVTEEVGIGTPAERAGLKGGDFFLSIGGKQVSTWAQLVDMVRHSDGQPIPFVVRRDGKEVAITITPMRGLDPLTGDQVWQIGVSPHLEDDYQRQPFLESAKDAGIATLGGMKQIAGVLGGLFTGKVSMRELQGIVGIARESGRAAKSGPMRLIELMAVISLNLGLLNLLPIPILDGGHVLLLAIEGTLRRDLSIAVKERFVQVGLVFLLGIFAFVMYSDILKLIQSH